MANHFDLEEQEQLDQLKHFWNTWGTLISGVIIVVFGGLAAWNGYQYWQNRQAAQASALSDAMEAAVSASDTDRIEQVLNDVKSRYSGTVQASQASLLAAKALADAGKSEAAVAALNWMPQGAVDDGYKALARLRLATLFIEQKAYDKALSQLSGAVPVGFEAAFADRRGDVLVLQDKKKEAAAEYLTAYKAFEERMEYRRLVEAKLNALGAQVPAQVVASAAQSGGAQ